MNPSGEATRASLPPSYKWWVVAMLWCVCFFNYADRQAIFAVFPKLKEEFGFDKVHLGLIGSAFMWVYAAGAPFAGLICDRFRRKDLILGGCLFWSFVTMATAWCSQIGTWAPVAGAGSWLAQAAQGGALVGTAAGAFGALVLVRALEGFGETFYFPASMSLTSDYHPRQTRSRALSFHQSSVYIGTILGSWIGAWFAEHIGWRMGFYLFGGLGMVLALVLYRFLHEPQRGGAELETASLAAHGVVTGAPLSVGETLRAIFRSPAAPLLMLAFVGANFVATIFLTWTPTFLVEKFGFKLTSAGLSATLFIHLASAASVPVAGLLADRLSRHFGGGRILVQACGLLIGAAFVATVGRTADKTTLILAMTVFGLCKGFYDSGIFASLYDVVEPRARGTAAGLMNTVGWGGGALGPLFVGWASTHGGKPTEVENMSDAIAWCGLIYVVAAGFLGLAIVLVRRADPPPAAVSLQP
jgi:MFS family permease